MKKTHYKNKFACSTFQMQKNVLIDPGFLVDCNVWCWWVFNGTFSGYANEGSGGVPRKCITAAATHQRLLPAAANIPELVHRPILGKNVFIIYCMHHIYHWWIQSTNLLALLRGVKTTLHKCLYEKNRNNQPGSGCDNCMWQCSSTMPQLPSPVGFVLFPAN